MSWPNTNGGFISGLFTGQVKTHGSVGRVGVTGPDPTRDNSKTSSPDPTREMLKTSWPDPRVGSWPVSSPVYNGHNDMVYDGHVDSLRVAAGTSTTSTRLRQARDTRRFRTYIRRMIFLSCCPLSYWYLFCLSPGSGVYIYLVCIAAVQL